MKARLTTRRVKLRHDMPRKATKADEQLAADGTGTWTCQSQGLVHEYRATGCCNAFAGAHREELCGGDLLSGILSTAHALYGMRIEPRKYAQLYLDEHRHPLRSTRSDFPGEREPNMSVTYR